VTSRCGCHRAAAAGALADPTEQDNEREVARDLQRRWRCPVAGHDPAPLDPRDLDPLGYDLAGALDTSAQVLGMRDCATCPLAAVERPSPMLAELATALMAVEEHAYTSVAEALDRPLTAVEHQALDVMLLARRERRAWEIEHPEKPKQPEEP